MCVRRLTGRKRKYVGNDAGFFFAEKSVVFDVEVYQTESMQLWGEVVV